MGIIGTVLGLIHVLAHLAAPATLGPSISGAFIATLMGVGSANVVFLPIGNRLKSLVAAGGRRACWSSRASSRSSPATTRASSGEAHDLRPARAARAGRRTTANAGWPRPPKAAA